MHVKRILVFVLAGHSNSDGWLVVLHRAIGGWKQRRPGSSSADRRTAQADDSGIYIYTS